MAQSPATTVAHAFLALCAGLVLLTSLPLPAAAAPAGTADAASAASATTAALARDKRCLNCHAIDRKLVGPAFKDVARRYGGQAGAPARLAEKIVRGGAGAWGPVPMPAHPQLSQADARLLAIWVLSVK